MTWIERRLPQGGEVFLDHVGWFVPDLGAVGPAFERLGFAVSPTNTHYAAGPDGKLVIAGTANRLVTPDLGYLEFLAASADTPLADQLRVGLARYTGVHLIAFGAADVPAVERRLAADGVPLQPTVHLRRPLDGGAGTVEATVLRAQPGTMAEGRVQYCAHGTPDLVWRREHMHHGNAVDALTDALIVAADPAEAVRRYERFAGRTSRPDADSLIAIPLDRGQLTFADPETAARYLPDFDPPALPCIAAVAMRTATLQTTRATLERNGVRALLDGETVICVGPGDAMGAWLIFHQARDFPIWADLAVARHG